MYLRKVASKKDSKTLERGVQGVIVPNLRTIVLARFPIVVAKIEGIISLNDIVLIHAGA